MSKTLAMLVIALLLVLPGASAEPLPDFDELARCSIATAEFIEGPSAIVVPRGSIGSVEAYVPGVDTDGNIGTYYVVVSVSDIKRCLDEVLP